MNQKERSLATILDTDLRSFGRQIRPLPGIRHAGHRAAFIEQLVESVRRVGYVSVVSKRDLSLDRCNPLSELFDPLKSAILQMRQGNIEEAFWLVFLFVHFGKSLSTGWRLVRDVYGALGNPPYWDWSRTSASPKLFRQWLKANQATLRGGDGIPRRFGNHRKYESLDADSANGTGEVVETYVKWVGPPGTHQMLMQKAEQQAGSDPRKAFNSLYQSMNAVKRFGRTARFDYLTMIGKLNLASIEPASAYMQGATGPLAGARLLFGGNSTNVATLDAWVSQLEAHLGLYFGMQVLEDALCNWQKSPGKFIPFRG